MKGVSSAHTKGLLFTHSPPAWTAGTHSMAQKLQYHSLCNSKHQTAFPSSPQVSSKYRSGFSWESHPLLAKTLGSDQLLTSPLPRRPLSLVRGKSTNCMVVLPTVCACTSTGFFYFCGSILACLLCVFLLRLWVPFGPVAASSPCSNGARCSLLFQQTGGSAWRFIDWTQRDWCPAVQLGWAQDHLDPGPKEA